MKGKSETLSPASTKVSTPPRRVPSLYPTTPPATLAPSQAPPQVRPVAHSLQPKATPITMESLQETRNSEALMKEELEEQTLYDLFEVDPHVSEEELRRAYKRVWACFHPDHFASYGLYSRVQLEVHLNQLQSAFELLMNAEQRKEYHQQTFPDGIPQKKAKASLKSSSRSVSIISTLITPREAQAFWDTTRPSETLGASLKELRGHFNLPLSVVHERSKISLSILELIEADAFRQLPAEVYLRGFLKVLLNLYGLFEVVSIDGYLNAYRAARRTT